MVGEEVKIGDYLFSIMGKDQSQIILIELLESLSGKVSTDTEAIVNGEIHSKISAISHYLSNNGTITAKIALPYENIQDTDPLKNAANKEEFARNTARSTAAYTLVREDASTGLTPKLPLEASYSRGLLHNRLCRCAAHNQST